MSKQHQTKGSNKWIGYVVSLLLAVLTASALSANIEVGNTLQEVIGKISGYGMMGLIFTAFSGVLYYRVFFKQRIPFSWMALILAVLFGLFTVVGESYYHLGNWDFLFANRYQLLLALFILAGYSLIFYVCLGWLFHALDKKQLLSVSVYAEKGFRSFFDRHTLFVSTALILICWLPIIVIFYPGSVPYDGLAELNMFFGVRALTNHHPLFVTCIMGMFMKLGKLFGADNYGIFLYVIAQSIFCALIFSASIKYLRKLNAPFLMQIAVLLYFALLPIWSGYAQAEIKDTLFTGIFVIYTLQIIDALKTSEEYFSRPLKILGFGAVSLLLCLMRNNGLYIAVPVGILLVLAVRGKHRLWGASSIAAVVVMFLIYSNLLLPALNVQPGSIKEMMSIPFQQTARYVVEHGDEVTTEEKAAIDTILPYDQLAEKYKPELSDPIKDMYREGVTSEQLMTYLKTWYSMLLKHPGTYIQAAINGCYGYFYPNGQIENRLLFQYYSQGEPQYTGYFNYAYSAGFADARELITDYSYFVWQVPGVGMLYNPAVYSWVLIIMCALLLRKKRIKALIGLIPALLTVLICCASPVNGLTRYMLPVMATVPLLVGWTIHQLKLAKEEEEALSDPEETSTSHSNRGHEMFRFAISGGVCFLVEYGCLIVLKEFFVVHYLIAAGIGFVLSVALNYLMCVRWVFPEAQDKGHKAKLLFFVTSLIGLVLNQLFMWAFVDGLGIYYLLAKVITTVLVMVWNYITKRKVLQGN